MNFPTARLLLLAVGLLIQPAVTAAPTARLPTTFDVTAVDAFLAAQVREASRVGLSVAVVRDGQVVLARGYGKRSLQDGRPVEPDTLFAIGSVSKQFTCACILLLVESGKLSVHDPVAKFYPNLTRAKDITLLDLMNHVSGYPDYYPLDFVDRRMQRPIAEDEIIAQYGGARLDFEPGSKYSYSNTGYILLGRIVEKVSGEKLGDFLARRIFKPLGMDHTLYEPDYSDSRLASGYTTFALSPPEAVAPEGRGWLCGAGGIFSTPTDLAKWNLALMSGLVLKPESLALMTAARKLTSGRISEYGCGLSVRTQSGRQVLSHNGAVSGFNASSAMIPSTRSAVIMMCNLDGGLGALPGQVLGLLLKEPSVVPAIKAAPVANTVKEVFAELQRGKVDRRRFGEEFNLYLTAEKLTGASKRLKPYGAPRKVEVLSTNERGGMEVTTTRLTFAKGTLQTLMYRMPDGQIEQFFVSKE
jgi:CubicO group peptidase (beta-lactamase class C family)